MSLDACEQAYVDLSKEIFTAAGSSVFSRARSLLGKEKFLQVNGRFDAKALEEAIKKTTRGQSFSEDILLKDDDPKCKV